MSKFLAIDLDPSGLFVAAGSARGGAAKVEQALAWTADAGGPPPLAADTAKAIGEQLRDRLRAAGIAAAPAVVAVGRDKVILKEVKFPPVAPAEEPALVRFQALKEITEAADEVVLDYAPVHGDPGDAERRALAVVLRKEVFASIQAVCAAAGLKLAGVTPRPFAVAAGLKRALAAGTAPAPEHAGDAVAVLTAGPAGGEVVVVRNGEVVFTRAVPAPVVASEPLLVGQVRRDLAVYAGQAPGHPVKAVYVAEVGLGGWANRLRTSLGVPVHAYDPLDGTAPDVPQTLRGRFAGAAGLLAAKAADTLPINFAAPRQPKAEANPKKQLAQLAVLAALILVGAGGAFGYMLVSQADEDVAKLERQKATLKKDIADLEPVGKQYEAVEQWQTREVVWLDELYDMTDRFPSGGVLLTQLDATPILPDKTGKQDAQFRLSLRLSTTRPETVDALITAIEKDSGGKKFYRETDKKTQQDVMTVSTKVLRRDPSEYVRRPVFQTPPRKLYAPSKDDAAAKEKDAASPKGDEQPGEDIDP